MSIRTMLIFGGLAFAASAPLIFSGSNNDAAGDADGSPFGYASASQSASNNQPTVISPPVQFNEPLFNVVSDFREIFNFNINPVWVKRRWSRITICPRIEGLSGFRVALVTGPLPSDIHGSLTYYFDGAQKLQRITFKGWTGDSSRIEQLVRRDFQFASQDSNGLAFYTAREWGKLKGVLRLDHPPVIDRNLANQQITMLLEINRPGGSHSLSQQTQRIIDSLN